MGGPREPAIESMPRYLEAVRQLAQARADPIVALVDASRCVGCGICIDACRDKAITVNDVAVVDPRLCVGCGACVPECPNEALARGRGPHERGATG
jgi:ferredoxin